MGILTKLGEFSYEKLWTLVKDINACVTDALGLTELLSSFAAIMPFAFMAVMLLFVFLGKKLLPYIKFVSVLCLGIGVGVYYVHPILPESLSIPAIVSGLVIGIIAAVFYRLIYIFIFAGAAFYGVFAACNHCLADVLASMGDLTVIYVGVALVAVVLAFILRKYAEMLGTAMIGARVIAINLVAMLGGVALGPDWVLPLILTAIVTFVGFLVQVKTRKRY